MRTIAVVLIFMMVTSCFAVKKNDLVVEIQDRAQRRHLEEAQKGQLEHHYAGTNSVNNHHYIPREDFNNYGGNTPAGG